MDDRSDHADEHFDNAAIEAFVSQPARHDDVVEADPVESAVVRAPWRRRLTHFFFEKEPSQYSSIAPRMPGGKRTKPFFFNGNGRGR